MDKKLMELLLENKLDTTHLQVGKNVFFLEDTETTTVEFIFRDNKKISYTLNLINDLFSGSKAFEYDNENWNDQYMPIIVSIETAITEYYTQNPDLKDKTVMILLERLISNPDTKMTNELGIILQNNLKLCLALNSFSKQEFKGSLKKILKSVKRHHKVEGRTGYLDFIVGFFKNSK